MGASDSRGCSGSPLDPQHRAVGRVAHRSMSSISAVTADCTRRSAGGDVGRRLRVDRAHRVEHGAEALPAVGDHRGHLGGQPAAQARADLLGQLGGEPQRDAVEPVDQAVVGDEPGRDAAGRGEPAGAELEAGGGRDDVGHLVRLVEHRHVVDRQDHPVGREVQPVEVGVHDRSRRRSRRVRRAASAKQSSPRGQFLAPGHSRGPTLTAAHVALGRLDVEVGPVAGVGARPRRRAASRSAARTPRSIRRPPARAARRPRRRPRRGAGGTGSSSGPSAPPTRRRGRGARRGTAAPCRPSWSCSALVAVATTTFRFERQRRRQVGQRLAGAGAGGHHRWRRRRMAAPTARAISCWPGRCSPSGPMASARRSSRASTVASGESDMDDP